MSGLCKTDSGRRCSAGALTILRLSITKELSPHAVVDARMAKHNLGTRLDEAEVVIGMGPGFVPAGTFTL